MGLRRLSVSAIEIGSLAIAVALSAALAYPAEAPVKKVTVAYTSFAPFFLPFLLEKDSGFFREEGLRPEFILVRSGGVAVRGLIAGDFDYISSASPIADAIIRSRQRLKLVSTISMIHFWVIARPEIRSLTDLKGKSVAISSLGSNTDLTMREVLRQQGMDPFKDVTFLGVGASRERFAALTSGVAHAALLSSPFNLKAVEMGYRKLAKTSDYVRWPSGGLGTTEEKINRNRQEVANAVRATLKGIKLVLTRKEYVLGKMIQIFRLTKEEAVQTYEEITEAFVPSGYLTSESESTFVSMMKQAANVQEDIRPDWIFDNSFAIQAERDLKAWQHHIPKR